MTDDEYNKDIKHDNILFEEMLRERVWQRRTKNLGEYLRCELQRQRKKETTEMKISFMLPWNQDITYWLQWADDHGIEGVELVYASHDAPTSYEFKPDEIKTALEGKKVKVCATTMFWINSLAKDSEERARAREFNENVIKTASAIGCPYAILGTGCYEPKNLEKNIEEFRKEHEYLVKLGESMDVQIAYHIGHNPTIADSMDAMRVLMREFPDLKLKLDPVGIIRNLKADPYYGMQILGPRMVHMHIKDVLRLPDGEIEPPVGLGEIKWNNIMAILYEQGYDGYLAIEPHGPKWGKIENYATYITLAKRHIEPLIV